MNSNTRYQLMLKNTGMIWKHRCQILHSNK